MLSFILYFSAITPVYLAICPLTHIHTKLPRAAVLYPLSQHVLPVTYSYTPPFSHYIKHTVWVMNYSKDKNQKFHLFPFRNYFLQYRYRCTVHSVVYLINTPTKAHIFI